MRMVKWVLIGLFLASSAQAQQQSPRSETVRELTAMLNQFLNDAGNNNLAGFDRFFADDVIYTGSNGMVHTKAEMMSSMQNSKQAAANNGKDTYSAEHVVVHDFGNTAIVAFQLVAHTEHADGRVEISNYRDTGTFLRRNGRWKVIAWQATKIPDNH